jgi:hypothetical protein
MYIFSIGQLYFRLAGRSSYQERSSRLAQFICMGKAMTYNLTGLRPSPASHVPRADLRGKGSGRI